jgi:CRP/FNR family transcriptional regulator, cyclic AMP receptor protein
MTWSAAPGFLELAGDAAAAAVRAEAGRSTFARGEALMHAEQVPREVLLLRSGRVKVSAATPGGRRLLLAFRGSGDLVGELSAIDEQPRSASVVALEPVEALVLPGARFRALLDQHPQAALALLRVLAERLRDADAKRVRLAGYTTMGRVASSLVELSDRFGEGGVPLSQEELAEWSGSSLESVARTLQTMRGLGWIETRRRAILVRDRAALSRAAA